MKKKHYTISDFICHECKNKVSLPRTRQREKGHIKTFYCPFCKTITDHTEIRSSESEMELQYTLSSRTINNIGYIGDSKELFKKILSLTDKDIFVVSNNPKLHRCCRSKKQEVDNYINYSNLTDIDDIIDYFIENNVSIIIVSTDIVLDKFDDFEVYKKIDNNNFINTTTKQIQTLSQIIRS